MKEKVKQATEELRRANIKLKELDVLKDEFVSVASHELRTPMTSIKNYVWMVLHGKGGKISKKQKFYLDRVAVSTERLIHMVGDMLTISRIERGKIEVKLTTGDIVKLAQEVVEELKGKAEEKKIKLSFAAPKKKMPLVLLDKDRIREVLVNLIGNAIKFTPAPVPLSGTVRGFASENRKKSPAKAGGGSPTGGKVTVSFEKKDGLVSTSVTDTGKGIDKKDIPIIDLHRGEIGVRSKLGEGSTFYFDLRTVK